MIISSVSFCVYIIYTHTYCNYFDVINANISIFICLTLLCCNILWISSLISSPPKHDNTTGVAAAPVTISHAGSGDEILISPAYFTCPRAARTIRHREARLKLGLIKRDYRRRPPASPCFSRGVARDKGIRAVKGSARWSSYTIWRDSLSAAS